MLAFGGISEQMLGEQCKYGDVMSRLTRCATPIYTMHYPPRLQVVHYDQRFYKMASVLNSFPKFKLISLWSNPVRCLHLSTLITQLRVLKRPVCTTGDYNPLLNQDGLPRFCAIKPKHVVPAIEQLTKDFEQDFTEFETGLTSESSL